MAPLPRLFPVLVPCMALFITSCPRPCAGLIKSFALFHKVRSCNPRCALGVRFYRHPRPHIQASFVAVWQSPAHSPFFQGGLPWVVADA